jgi:hypothetical protein
MYSLPLLALTAALTGNTSPSLSHDPGTPCPHSGPPLETRKSPLDSLTFSVAGKQVKVCYGRPSSRGRQMLGGEAVPYGKLWRTGANEPTIFSTPIPLSIAGVEVKPGVYSLYTVPGPREWEIIVNRSTDQWGEESRYTPEVKAQEVGRGKVRSEPAKTPVETFTITAEPTGNKATTLVLEWEKTRVKIPVRAAGGQQSS